MSELLAFWRSLPLGPAPRGALWALLLGVGLFVLVHGIERRHHISAASYRSRAFLHDVAYWFYYRLGLHYFIFLGAVFAVFSGLLPKPAAGPLSGLPFALQALIYFALVDLCVYWVHRAQHRFPWLWAFHSVHHSQTELTFATSQRVHPLDHLFQDLLMFLPLWLLGFNEAAWIPLYLAGELTLALQHSRIPWTYGPLYRVLVSPVFHRCHHAVDPTYHHSNFAGLFSFWDYLFGTASRPGAELPQRFGVAGLQHATLLDTLIGPFRQLRSGKRVTAQTTPVEEPDVRN